METTSTTGDDLDYFLGGVVEATGAGCVVTEPGDFRGSVGFYPDPTDDEIQTAVDFIQGGGDSIPCNQFFAIPFAGYFLSVFCPN